MPSLFNFSFSAFPLSAFSPSPFSCQFVWLVVPIILLSMILSSMILSTSPHPLPFTRYPPRRLRRLPLPTRYPLPVTSYSPRRLRRLLLPVDLRPDGEHHIAEYKRENFRRKLIADSGELMADYLLRKYLAKPPSCRDILRHFLQRTSTTAFLTNFSLTASRYMLRTSPDDPLEISRNRENSVGVVRSEPVPLWSDETTPQGSASLLSSFCIEI